MGCLNAPIERIEAWHLAVPVTSRRDHGIGAVDGACEIVVLRLTSADGEGWGEASCWSVFTGTPEASFAALTRYLPPVILGKPIGARAAIMEAARHAVAHCTEAKAALDTALCDMAARAAGVPVWALLGGKARDDIPLSVSIANPDFEADRALMQRLVADGVGLVKLKAGFRDHAFDMMRCEVIRRDFPSLRLRVDYNQGLHGDDATARVLDVATFQPDFIEQPVRAASRGLMARLRAACPVPLLADESIFGPEDMGDARDICDGVSIKIMKSGGLSRAQTVARMAAAQGLMAYGGDMFETGLAHLAGTHMIAATPEITLGCEFYQARYYLAEDLLDTPFPCENGKVQVPDSPGLGAKPRRDILKRWAKQHAEIGLGDL